MLNQGVGRDKGIIFPSKLLDQLLVLIELLQVVGRHSVDTVVLGSVNVVLVAKDTVESFPSVLYLVIPLRYIRALVYKQH